VVFLSVGKAYAIFKTKDAADAAISKINSGLVVGGRYLFVVDVIYLVSYSVTIFSSSGVLFVLSILELSWQINCWNYELEQRVFLGDALIH
jgi:hypothetical protein